MNIKLYSILFLTMLSALSLSGCSDKNDEDYEYVYLPVFEHCRDDFLRLLNKERIFTEYHYNYIDLIGFTDFSPNLTGLYRIRREKNWTDDGFIGLYNEVLFSCASGLMHKKFEIDDPDLQEFIIRNRRLGYEEHRVIVKGDKASVYFW